MKISQHRTYIEGHRFEDTMANIKCEQMPQIHLSHGLNELLIPRTLKNTMRMDIEAEGFRNYGDIDYDRLLCGLITNYHNLRSTTSLPWGHCNVIESATFALSCLANYARFKASFTQPTVLLAGLNYYLIYEILHQTGFRINNLFGESSESSQPTAEELIGELKTKSHDVLVLSQPSNPTGEVYSSSDLLAIYQTCVETKTFLVLDCICSDLESEASAQFDKSFTSKAIAQGHLAIIDGITKRRSCAGIRTAYLLGSQDLMKYVDYHNETMIFYPPFLGIKVMIVEYLFQNIAWLCKTTGCSFDQALGKTVSTVTDLAETQSKKGKFWELIEEIVPANYLQQFSSYIQDTYSVKKTILQNQSYFMATMYDYLETATRIQSGFSCAAILKNNRDLVQKQLCTDIYRKIGVYLYPDVYFGNLNHETDYKFWIRIGCAVPPEEFKEGTNRLLNYMKEKTK